MDFGVENIAGKCISAINQRIRELKRLNIIVIGKSGAGKSTLINSVFRGAVAQTGLGRPVTDKIRLIEKKDFPLAIYDTPGFELSDDQQSKVIDDVIKLITDGGKKRDINKAIHCIWYCINVGGNRTFDEKELKWLRTFTEKSRLTQVPVMIVLTQGCPRSKAQAMKSLVEAENLDVVSVIPVLAQDMNFDDEYTAKAYGLDRLIDVMSEALPDELQNTLNNVQKANMTVKKKRARAVVAATVATAFTEGFIPIPTADAMALVPTQIGMIATITVIYGNDVSKSILTAFISSAVMPLMATLAGRTASTGLLKLLPGIGTVAGGVISGATAGVITTVLGETYIALMELIAKGEIKAEEMSEEELSACVDGLIREKTKKD